MRPHSPPANTAHYAGEDVPVVERQIGPFDAPKAFRKALQSDRPGFGGEMGLNFCECFAASLG